MAEAALGVVEGLQPLGVADPAVAACQHGQVAAGVQQQRLHLQRLSEVELGVVVADGQVAEHLDALEVLGAGQHHHHHHQQEEQD